MASNRVSVVFVLLLALLLASSEARDLASVKSEADGKVKNDAFVYREPPICKKVCPPSKQCCKLGARYYYLCCL